MTLRRVRRPQILDTESIDTAHPRLVVAYAWGTQNAGDHEITRGTLRLLERVVPDARIGLISRFGANEREGGELHFNQAQVRLVPGPFEYFGASRIGEFRRVLSGLRVMTSALVSPRLSQRTPALESIVRATGVLLNGGNLLYSGTKRLSRLYAALLPALVANRLGKPVALLGQSIGELPKTPLLEWSLRKAKLVWCRESVSARGLSEQGIVHNVYVGLDMAFFSDALDSEGACRLLQENGVTGQFVAIVVRETALGDWGLLDRSDVAKAEAHLVDAIGNLLWKRPYMQVVVVCQTISDRDFSKRIAHRIASRTSRPVGYIETFDAAVLRGIYARARVVVASRFHAGVFALSVGTPVVALWYSGWGPKLPGMLTDFGLADCVVDMSTGDARLLESVVARCLQAGNGLRNQISSTVEMKRREGEEVLSQWLDRWVLTSRDREFAK